MIVGKRNLENENAVFRFRPGTRVVPRENEKENGKTEGKTKGLYREALVFPRTVRLIF